jgi:hypothetical protein
MNKNMLNKQQTYKLNTKEQAERLETLSTWYNPPGTMYVTTCSGTLTRLPQTQSEWDDFYENSQFVDGVELSINALVE